MLSTVLWVLVLFVVVFWIAIFLVFFSAHGVDVGAVIGGEYEPLPEHMGGWQVVAESGSLIVEERILEARTRHSLIRQVRYRDRRSCEIVRILPEQVIRRKRKRQSVT